MIFSIVSSYISMLIANNHHSFFQLSFEMWWFHQSKHYIYMQVQLGLWYELTIN